MLHMENSLSQILSNLLNDIEEASPNSRSSLYSIYPINFVLALKGHKKIHVQLEEDHKRISFKKLLLQILKYTPTSQKFFNLFLQRK